MKKEPITALDLDAFQRMFVQLAQPQRHLCWIRSLDFKRQLYLSDSFEAIFGAKAELLYEHPESWYDLLLPRDHHDMTHLMPKRIKNPIAHNGDNLVFYRIKSGTGTIYIRDWSILLKDRSGDLIAVGGVAEKISAQDWYESQDATIDRPHPISDGNSLQLVLQAERSIQLTSTHDFSEIPLPKKLRIQGIPIHLSQREYDCLYQLCLGKSAKETAEALFISPRTVETHIENIKQKAQCSTKLELMSHIFRSINSGGS